MKQDSKHTGLANCCFQRQGMPLLTDKIEVTGTESSKPQPPAKSMGKGSVAAFQGSPREKMGGRGVADSLGCLKLVFSASSVSNRDRRKGTKNPALLQITMKFQGSVHLLRTLIVFIHSFDYSFRAHHVTACLIPISQSSVQ